MLLVWDVYIFSIPMIDLHKGGVELVAKAIEQLMLFRSLFCINTRYMVNRYDVYKNIDKMNIQPISCGFGSCTRYYNC